MFLTLSFITGKFTLTSKLITDFAAHTFDMLLSQG